MLNPKNVDRIVSSTLKRMGVHEVSIANLVKGTFAMETDLSSVYEDDSFGGKRIGLMGLSERKFKNFLNEKVSFRKSLKEKILHATGVDMEAEDFGQLVEDLEFNLAFQVAITYSIYSLQYDKYPEDNLTELSKYYSVYWLNELDNTNKMKEFVQKYKDTFVIQEK